MLHTCHKPGWKTSDKCRQAKNLPYNPNRFELCLEVLTKEYTENIYYEVQVKGKTDWVVGVVRESADRKTDMALSVENGYWTTGLTQGKYSANTEPSVEITLKEKLKKVDDVNSKSHMYSFSGYLFTEKTLPILLPSRQHEWNNLCPSSS